MSVDGQLETIVAIATPPGRGGVGIIRLSGKLALTIAQQILSSGNTELKPRHAYYQDFFLDGNELIDQGIVIYFKAPHSFTGEDVVEFQGHGGPVVLDLLVQRTVQLGARLARPGEFSERAFLNDKLDLAQAEAVSDLIEASSAQAVKSALRSLQGQFSQQVHQLVEQLIQLRLFVEAAIDFPEEEVDFLSDGKILNGISGLLDSIEQLQKQAQQGAILRDGMSVVLAGKPNAGKSSLLNALSGSDSAIVTDIPGTTRDVLKEQINIDGMPLHIIDTAGLRAAQDEVEKIGIDRTKNEIAKADRVLLVIDHSDPDKANTLNNLIADLKNNIGALPPMTVLNNKYDLTGHTEQSGGYSEQHKLLEINISAKYSSGIDLLRQHLKQVMGYQDSDSGVFMARRRHIEAISAGYQHVEQARHQLIEFKAGELVAEDLKMAQYALSEITGEFSADDLLGRIFSSFCIGK